MASRWNWLFLLLFIAALQLPAPVAWTADAESDFEIPQLWTKYQVLAPEASPESNYQIRSKVASDGYFYIFDLDTPFGTTKIVSRELLKIRLKEWAALEKLEAIKGTDTYKEAVKKAAMSPVHLAKSLVTQPIKTSKGVASGVGSYFSNIGHSLFGKPSEQEENVWKTALGVAEAKRKLAFHAGVDPYSDYKPLQERLDELGWTAFAGSMTITAAFSFIPGVTGHVVSGTKFSNGMNELLRDLAPADLKRMHKKKLEAMGAPEQIIEQFLDQPYYSPTRKTYLIGALEQMATTKNRAKFIERAALAPDEFMAFYFQRQAEMYAGYHVRIQPVVEFMNVGTYPLALDAKGTAVGIFPTDYLYWTRDLADSARGGTAAKLGTDARVKARELWFEGKVSDKARENFTQRGWSVHEEVGGKLYLD